MVTITGGRDAVLQQLAALHRGAQASLLVLAVGALFMAIGGMVAAQAGWHIPSLVAGAVGAASGLALMVVSYWMRTRWRDPFRPRLARELLIHLPIMPGSSVMVEVALRAAHSDGGVQIGASYNHAVQLSLNYQAIHTSRIQAVRQRQKVYGNIGGARFVKRIDTTPLGVRHHAIQQEVELMVSVSPAMTALIEQLCRRDHQPSALNLAPIEPTAASMTLISRQLEKSVDPGLSAKQIAHCTNALDHVGQLLATLHGDARP